MHKSIFLHYCDDLELNNIKQINVDSVFIGFENLAKVNFLRGALKPGTKLYVSLNVFNARKVGYLDQFKETSKVIDAFNNEIPDGFLCPNSEEVRNACIENVKKILDAEVDGIWLDWLRFPSAPGNPRPVFYETCYCDTCFKKFEQAIEEKVVGATPEEKHLYIDGKFYIEWIDFKTDTIASLVKNVKETIDASGKKVALGYVAVPLEGNEYGEAVKRVMGQDFMKLSNYVTYISPTLYHRNMHRNTEWIKEKVYYFAQVGNTVLPLVQTANTPEAFDSEEFRSALENASKYPSSGVIVFHLADLLSQAGKLYTLNDIFNATE